MSERKENLLANTLFPRLSKMCSDLQKSRPPAGHGVSIAHSLHICEQKGGGGEEKNRGTSSRKKNRVASETFARFVSREPIDRRSESKSSTTSFHADLLYMRGGVGRKKVREAICPFSPIDPNNLDNADVRDRDETRRNWGKREGCSFDRTFAV